MIINLKEEELERTYELLNVREINISLADILFTIFEDPSFYERANRYEDYFDAILDYYVIPKDDKHDKPILEKVLKPQIFPSKPNYFDENPYFCNVRPKPFKYKGYELKYLSYKPYQPFSLNEITVDYKDHYLEYSPISYFTNEEHYLALTHLDEVWMSITPNEINTMQSSIDKATGEVLVLGLGLGYYPYMISLKEEVSDITIVEIDETIIDLFNKYLLPFFPHQEKITIIKGDAIKYLQESDNKYDTIFIDLWHNPVDGLPLYIKCKNLEYRFKESKFQYWLEESLIALIRRCLLTIYEEAIDNYKEENYLKSKNEMDKIINHLYFKTKNISINSYNDLYNLISNESILKIIIDQH